MRILFFLLALFLAVQLQAQLLNLEKEWFEIDGFFKPQAVQNNGIKSITIRSSNKLDGQKIRTKKDVLIYEFYPNGQLKRGLKVNEFINKLDTVSITFYYDLESRLFKKMEHFKYFSFAYYYKYNPKGELINEIKVDVKDKSIDTLYIRRFEYEDKDSVIIQTVKNENSKIFQLKSTITKPSFKSIKIAYTQNQSYLLDEFYYEKEQLKESKFSAFYKDLNQMRFKFYYKEGLLDEQEQYKNQVLTLKRAILYETKGLVKNIIERNYVEQTINIYYFDYRYY